jgi:hypothetical protein
MDWPRSWKTIITDELKEADPRQGGHQGIPEGSDKISRALKRKQKNRTET